MTYQIIYVTFTPDGRAVIYDRDGKVYRREVTR